MTTPLHLIRSSLWLRGALVALLLGCVGIGVFGEWLVFSIIHADIHRAVWQQKKAGLARESLLLIKIANQELVNKRAVIEEEELKYHGKWYDIIQQEAVNDSTYFYCLYDERESKLYADLAATFQAAFSEDPSHQKKQSELRYQIPEFYLLAAPLTCLHYHNVITSPVAPLFTALETSIAIFAPPPELA